MSGQAVVERTGLGTKAGGLAFDAVGVIAPWLTDSVLVEVDASGTALSAGFPNPLDAIEQLSFCCF